MANNNCPPGDPCFCINTSSTPNPPSPCPDGDCCLKVCHSVLECTDAVGPCGQSGSFDLATLPHITTGCVGSVKYSLENHDNFFTSVTISKSGILTWVTSDATTVQKYGSICYKLTCDSECEDCLVLNSLGYIDIGVKDLCLGVVCDNECESCNSCTGSCSSNSISISGTQGNTDVNPRVVSKNGDIVKWKVKVCGDSFFDSKNVELVFTIPSGVSLTGPSTPPSTVINVPSGVYVDATDTWIVGDIVAGTCAEVEFEFTVDDITLANPLDDTFIISSVLSSDCVATFSNLDLYLIQVIEECVELDIQIGSDENETNTGSIDIEIG